LIKFTLNIKNDIFRVECETVSPIIAVEIDNESYVNNSFSDIKHFESIINHVVFKIFKGPDLIYENLSTNQPLKFSVAFQIAQKISRSTYCSGEEIEKFQKLCEEFLGGKSNQMPPELMIATNIFNGTIQFSYEDIKNIENKRYEKINLALQALQESIGKDNE